MRRGFSLVELSIVLVILGLLTGGILAGQSLIRASEMRSVVSDTQRYITAFQSFRDKYMAFPGDMNNAVKFWGAQAGGTANGLDATCAALTTASTSAATCNGDGNGRIAAFTVEYYESLRAWQHLANAGLIEGSYTGVAGAGGATQCVIGTNCPAAKISNAGYGVGYSASTGSGAIKAPNSHVIYFGAQHASSVPLGFALKGEEAWNLDIKLDDGKPGFGRILGPSNTARPNCVTTDDPATSEYQLTIGTAGCNIYILF